MGKGVIMELRNRKAVVLTPEGEFLNIRLAKDHHHAVGHEISLEMPTVSKRVFSPFKNIRTIPAFSYGAAFIVFCLILTNFFFFQSPNHAVAAYVSFDINPSVEVSVDEDLDVIKVTAMNEDAEKLIPDFEDYYGKDIDEFANFFFKQIKSSGYLADYNEILVVTTVKDDRKQSAIEDDIEQRINEAKEATITEDEVEVVVEATTEEKHEEAKKNGLSTGKYVTYLEAKNNGSNITVDEAKKMPIEKLREKAHPGKGKAKGKYKNNGNKQDKKGNNNGNGNVKENPSKNHPGNNGKNKNWDNNGKSSENNGNNEGNGHDDNSAHSNSNSKEDKHPGKKNGNNNGNNNGKNNGQHNGNKNGQNNGHKNYFKDSDNYWKEKQ